MSPLSEAIVWSLEVLPPWPEAPIFAYALKSVTSMLQPPPLHVAPPHSSSLPAFPKLPVETRVSVFGDSSCQTNRSALLSLSSAVNFSLERT